jgi:hypothetical protein
MSPAEKEARQEQADRKMRAAAEKAYNKEMPEADTTFGKLGRKAAGIAMAPAGALVGGALLGTQPGSPGIIDSAKFGAKSMYHRLAGNKKEDDEATQDYLDAAKRAQSIETKRNTGETTNPAGDSYKKGGMTAKYQSFSKTGKPDGMKKVTKMANGGFVRAADGIAQRGKTRGKLV